jgi:hypothetical protein
MKGVGVLMDESLTDQERVQLRAHAIKRIRDLKADLDESEGLYHYEQRGASHMVPPFQRERFNEALRNLRRVGEDIPDALIRPPQPIPLRPAKTAPIEGWIDGSMLRADIKRMLERVDPQR